MIKAIRTFHRRVGPWLFPLLIVSAVTGLSYRVGRAWFGMEDDIGDKLMSVHSGEWISEKFSPFYVLLVGGGLLCLIAGGVCLVFTSKARKGARRWHRIVGAVLALPLAATAATGVLFKLGDEWFGFSTETKKLLMIIHQGSWLGAQARVYYMIVIGLGLLALGILGLALLKFPRRKVVE